ncbi:hypothetical protein BJ165DRAFT_1524895 [Panaeolus papilionaceus]|nr:hypothetical protein BJ165DRAFT_1524895 [Panaeolus papilionaceus]
MFDTNRSIVREITNFTSIPYDGYEEVIGALISEDLQCAIQRAVLHGIEIGRNAQKEEARQQLEQYQNDLTRMRQERDDARETNMRYRDEVMGKERELRETKDRLVAVQVAFDDMQETMMGTGPLRSETPPAQRSRENSDSEDSDSEFWVPDTDDELDDYEVAQMLALMEEDFLLQREIWEARVQPTSEERADIVTVVEPTSEFSQGSSTVVVTPRTPRRPHQSPGVVDMTEMERLMRLAQEPNQRDVVKSMKDALLAAERTPKARRTEAQRYLLRKWKKPGHSKRPGAVDEVLEAEIKACDHEVIVDASSFGVGFIHKFGEHEVGWIGWRFTSGAVIPLGPDGNIIMSWAEMIAVEAGLRAFIAQGNQACSLLLRSDNMGVIKAIKDRTWMAKFGLDEILQRVLRLCQENEIKLVPLWIWTEENPADAISRGRYPSDDTKLWVPLSLSPELGPILHPA